MSIKLTATKTNTENTKVLSGIDIKTGKVHTGKSDHEKNIPDEAVNVIIGVFFDGTNNNRYNTKARLLHEKRESDEKLSEEEEEQADTYTYWKFGTTEKEGSYANDDSNVVRLEPFYKLKSGGKVLQTRIYINGAGTEDGEHNNPVGLGLAIGDTGVRTKVKRACEKAANKINEVLKKENKKINKLTIDVFGFSRGAAEARNFVHEITQKKGDVKKELGGARKKIRYQQDNGLLGKHLTKEGVELTKKIDIRYAGLFDTVLSVGLPIQHKRSVTRLKMAAINKARFTFQIAAAAEHRKNFKLTNINSAVRNGRGLQKTFPGVHSDIGGGYVNNEADEVMLLPKTVNYRKIKKEQDYLIDQGWYNLSEIPIVPSYTKISKYHLEGNRKSVSNRYSYIPLQVMAEFSKGKKIDIEVGRLKSKYPVIEILLIKVKSELDKYVRGERGEMKFENIEDRETIKTLRNKYFHWSSNFDSIGMDANIENGKRVRTIFNG